MAEQLAIDIIAHDINAKRTLKDVEKQSDDTGNSLEHLNKESVGVGESLTNLGEAAERSTVSVGKVDTQSKLVTKQLDETKKHLKELVQEFDRTANIDLLPRIRRDRATIATLEKLKKELDSVEESGKTAGSSLAKGLLSGGPLLVIGIAAAVAAAAPAIGAIIGGAVLGAVGAGGVVGGIVAAAQDGRVSDAFSAMGKRLKGALVESGQPFLAPLLHEVNDLELAGYKATNILKSGLSDIAPVLRPLVQGIGAFIDKLGPGLDAVFGGGGKTALRAFANELPRIGDAITGALTDIEGGSEGGVEGMIALTRAVEGFIRGTGSFVRAMEDTYDWLVRTANAATEFDLKVVDALSFISKIPIIGQAFDLAAGKIRDIHDQTQGYIDAATAAADSSNDFAYGLEGTADSAEEAKKKVQDLADAIDELFGKQMSWDEAQIHLRQGLRDLIEELTHGKRTLAENTAEGDKNREAIIKQIQKIEDLRDAYYQQTGSLEGANKMYGDQLEQLRTLLIKLGYNKQLVNDLIDAYKRIPAQAGPKSVTAPGLTGVQQTLKKVEDTLNRLDGTHYRAYVDVYDSAYRAGERNPGRAGGGMVAAGSSYWVGENGPEVVQFGANGRVIPTPQSRAMTTAPAPQPPVFQFRSNGGTFEDAVVSAFEKAFRNGRITVLQVA